MALGAGVLTAGFAAFDGLVAIFGAGPGAYFFTDSLVDLLAGAAFGAFWIFFVFGATGAFLATGFFSFWATGVVLAFDWLLSFGSDFGST